MSGLFRFLAVVTAAWLALVALLWLSQRRLIYLPDTRMPPAPAGIEVVATEAVDGTPHRVWRVPTEGEPVAVVVVFNGNAGHKGHRLPLAADLAAEGLEVLLFDYRGYGDTPGRPSEAGLLDDARAVAELAFSRRLPVVYFGESLGAAVATRLATERSPAALVLRSPFTSLADVARHHYRIVPAGFLLWDRWEVESIIGEVEAPVLVIVGDADSVVPPPLSRRVYEAAPEPRSLVTFEGLDHNDWGLHSGTDLAAAVRRFLPRS